LSERNRLKTAAESLLPVPRISSNAEMGGSACETFRGSYVAGNSRNGGRMIRSNSKGFPELIEGLG